MLTNAKQRRLGSRKSKGRPNIFCKTFRDHRAVSPISQLRTRSEHATSGFFGGQVFTDTYSIFMKWSKATSTNTRPPENDNLRGEYLTLYEDVEPDIRWASIALQRKPDAINLWIGNSDSVTALHRDNYENIYCQILGSKDFVLLPPVETACVNERFLPSATYSETMDIIPDDPSTQVPCATWDPDKPSENRTEFSHLSKPARVRLDPGDMLYLPACWWVSWLFYRFLTFDRRRYHKVSQRNSKEGLCCSVNYCKLTSCMNAFSWGLISSRVRYGLRWHLSYF